MQVGGDWATHQLAEFVAAVSSSEDQQSALRSAVERAAEALDGEFGAVVDGETVLCAIGFPRHAVPEELLHDVARSGRTTTVDVPTMGPCLFLVVRLAEDGDRRLLLGRLSLEPFEPVEINVVRAMGRVLHQSLRLIQLLEEERALRSETERQSLERQRLVTSLTERQSLLERLARIQRSISHRAPLQEVLDGITAGAGELLGEELVGLRLVDPDDPAYFYLASLWGGDDQLRHDLQRGAVGQGAGGRAIAEDRLVIFEDYQHEGSAIPALRAHDLVAAMAAPVHHDGKPCGSLVVASYQPGRRYSPQEQEALLAFAEHASLALTDARTVEALREAHRTKDRFLAMVSHELKTPLTVIMGTIRTLQNHPEAIPPDVRDQMLQAAFSRGRDLERLIDRLLRGARAELAGARQRAELRQVVAAALCGFEVTGRVVVDELPDIEVDVDTIALQDVIGNLVENAIAHSPAGTTIDVRASVVGHELLLCVTNVGTLPADLDLATLFLPFQRGSAATSWALGSGSTSQPDWQRPYTGGSTSGPTAVPSSSPSAFR